MNSNLLWIDLETTGLNPERDRILEVAASITDNTGNVLVSKDTVFDVDSETLSMDPVVREMHESSGLMTAIRQCLGNGVKEILLYDTLVSLIKDYLDINEKIILAGSGISHFDRRFLDARHPFFLRTYFYYWNMDIGVIRRFFQLTGVPFDDLNETKSHRARQDLNISISQYRLFQQMIKR